MTDITESRIAVEHFGRHRLNQPSAQITPLEQLLVTDLGVLATFEKGSDADQTDVVIPHHSVDTLVTWHLECVLEHWEANQILCFAYWKSYQRTFEGSSTCLRKEGFFLAIVRNVSSVF